MNLIEVLTQYLLSHPLTETRFKDEDDQLQMQEYFPAEDFKGFYIVYDFITGVPDVDLNSFYDTIDFRLQFNIWGFSNGGVTRAAEDFEESMKVFEYRLGKKRIVAIPIDLYKGSVEEPHYRKIMEYRFLVQ